MSVFVHSNEVENSRPANFLRASVRMMSFLISLPRRLYLYVREVVYGEGHVWSTVAEDESDEESGWSTSEEEEAGSTQKQTRRTKGKSDKKPCKKKKSSKKEPPPIPPKPQNPSTSVSNTSLTPPSSPTNSEEKMLDNSSFDDISGQKPLKSYKRVPGPQGRRKPIRYSHLKSAELSENGAM